MRRLVTLVLPLVLAIATASEAATPLGPEFRVSEPDALFDGRPDVAVAADGSFAVVWVGPLPGADTSFDVWMRRYTAAGVAVAPPVRVNTSGDGVAEDSAAVAFDAAGGLVVVWRRIEGSSAFVHGRRYSATGAPTTGEFRVDVTTSTNAFGASTPDAAFDAGGNFLVAWGRADESGSGDVRARTFGSDGTPITGEVVLGPGSGPSVASDPAATGFLVAFNPAAPDVRVQRFSAEGAPVGAVVDANPSRLAVRSEPEIAVDGRGRFVVAFLAEIAGVGLPAMAYLFEADGVLRGGPMQVSASAGDFLSLGGVVADSRGNFLVVSASPDGGGCGPTGCDDERGVWAQRFTETGAAYPEGVFRLNDDPAGLQWFPAVGIDARGRFVVAWEFHSAEESGTVNAVFGRRFGSIDDTRAAPVDFGGNGDTDVAIFRPSQGRWAADFDFQPSVEMNVVYGQSGDVPVPKDWNGDGFTDLAVFRPATGNWFLDFDRNGGSNFRMTYGRGGDVPVPGDYDGNGTVDLAVFRPASSTWFVDLNRNGGTDLQRVLGGAGQIPVPGDYDGDGRTDMAVFGAGRWRIDLGSNGSVDLDVVYGRAGDVPIPGDYDGDGVTDLAVFRPEGAGWFIDTNRNGGSDLRVAYGFGSDIPVPGDFDGDGGWDLAVYRPSSGRWFVDVNGNGGSDFAVTFGAPGDRPLRENGWILDTLGVVP